MALEIKRTGPPTTRNGREWLVRLSPGEPPQEWCQMFVHVAGPGPFPARIHPSAVRFTGDGLFFPGDDPTNVPRWIEYIDNWIAKANGLYAEREKKQQQSAEAQRQAAADEAERIRQLNERFRNL